MNFMKGRGPEGEGRGGGWVDTRWGQWLNLYTVPQGRQATIMVSKFRIYFSEGKGENWFMFIVLTFVLIVRRNYISCFYKNFNC